MQRQQSNHFRFEGIEFWAERGMVTLVDEMQAGDSRVHVTQAIKRIAPGEFMKRAIAVRRGSALITPESVLGRVGGSKIRLEDPRKMLLHGVQMVPDFSIPLTQAITPQVAARLTRERQARGPRK
jgi:hypothetical protein